MREQARFLSSREVYGKTRFDPSREDDRPAPNNVCGVTKMLAEGLETWAASMYDLDYTVLRLTNVYGLGGDHYNVQAMITKALSEVKIEISAITQVMNLVYVEDVAEAVLRFWEILVHPNRLSTLAPRTQ